MELITEIVIGSANAQNGSQFIRLNKNGKPCKQDINATLVALYKAGEINYDKLRCLRGALPTKAWLTTVAYIDKRYIRIWIVKDGVVAVGALFKGDDYIDKRGILNIHGKISRIVRKKNRLVFWKPIISDRAPNKTHGYISRQSNVIEEPIEVVEMEGNLLDALMNIE